MKQRLNLLLFKGKEITLKEHLSKSAFLYRVCEA